MRQVVCSFLLLLPILLCSITRTVSLDGTQQYTSIQTAIDASSNGDIVEVYPGEYYENLNTNSRSIRIQSKYHITLDDNTIQNTIIHSSVPFCCLKIVQGESVILNGFTLTNNYPVNLAQRLAISGNYSKGGGIQVENNSSIEIRNCIVRNCMAYGVGGIFFSGSNFYMSNTKVYECFGLESAGGIGIGGDDLSTVIFDSIHPNSIYNNTAMYGMDMELQGWSQPINIVLDTFSADISEPDNFYFLTDSSTNVTMSIANSYFNLVNSDLYVSPDGDDTNSGLSPQTPLKTIHHAVKLVASDSLNPVTIHLAPGLYNVTGSGQYFPFTIKAHTRIIGDSSETTVIDAENYDRSYLGYYMQPDICIEKMKFIQRDAYTPALKIAGSDRVYLRDLVFEGIFTGYYERIGLIADSNVVCENIKVADVQTTWDNLVFRLSGCRNVVFNNLVLDNLDIAGQGSYIGILSLSSDLKIRNSIISNCDAYDAFVLYYRNYLSTPQDYTLELTNSLISYNQFDNFSTSWGPIYLENVHQSMRITNCTIANNIGAHTRVMMIAGNCDIANSIFYNPNNYREVVMTMTTGITSYHPSIYNSLIYGNYFSTYPDMINTYNVLSGIDPMFLGITHFDIVQPEYYQLSDHSPCINSGSRDTLGLNLPPMDLAGNYRVWDDRIDMGCFEYGAEHFVSNNNPEYPALSEKILLSIYPNPVMINGSKGGYAFIEFTLPQKAKQKPVVEIYNLKGQKVRTITLSQSYTDLVRKVELSKRTGQSGEFYSTVFDCRNENGQKLSSGIYIVKVKADDRQTSCKMTLLK